VDRLFTPWRLDYVTSKKSDDECIFCHALAGELPDPLIVFVGRTAYVIANRYPYNNGHVMVVPRRHVASLVELTIDELHEVALLTQRSEAVLREAYTPGGINIGLNLGKPSGGGIHYHLHVHLVPRWVGDANFMSVIGDTRVIAEELTTTVERLRPIYQKMAGAVS
jgi:ATP adenylyltransferase